MDRVGIGFRDRDRDKIGIGYRDRDSDRVGIGIGIWIRIGIG